MTTALKNLAIGDSFTISECWSKEPPFCHPYFLRQKPKEGLWIADQGPDALGIPCWVTYLDSDLLVEVENKE